MANLELNGRGNFLDARLDNAQQYPVAAKARLGHKSNSPDMITSHLGPLHFYQMALPVPTPKPGSFDATLAGRGRTVFAGKARCATCHVPPLFTEPGWNAHKAADIGVDDFQANRSPDKRYRTTPLRGLWAHQKGGFYHDGHFPTLQSVVEHYNQTFKRNLTDREILDPVEYLKSL